MNHAVGHWQYKFFAAAMLVAVGPLGRAQSAPADAPHGAPTPAAPATADRAYLGVMIGTEDGGGGVKLEQVLDGSPAAKAGLQAGDVITALGDHTIGSEAELREVISSHQVGEKVKVTFLRDGEKRRTSARLAKAPAETEVEGATGEEHEAPAVAEPPAKRAAASTKPPAAPKARSTRAVEVGPASGAGAGSSSDGNPGYMGVQLSQDDSGRATVAQVVDGSPAEKAGIKEGDVILSIDATEAGSSEDLVKLVQSHHAGDKVTVTVERDGAKQKLKVKLGQRSEAVAGSSGSGAGGGSIAVPLAPAPPAPPTAAEPAKPIKARGRIAAPSAAEAESHDAMRKEFDDLRAELEKTRKEMDDLRRKCETQQRTIEAIRRALGGGEPGSTSMAAPESSPGGDSGAVVSIPVSSGSMGTSEVTFTKPAVAATGAAKADAPAECCATTSGEGSCCAATGEGQAVAASSAKGDVAQFVVTSGDGDGQGKVIVLPLVDGSGAKVLNLDGQSGQVQFQVEGDDGEVKQVHGHAHGQAHGLALGGGHAIQLKPTGTDGTFELVLSDEGEEGGEQSEITLGDGSGEGAECCEEDEKGEGGEHTIVLQLGNDHKIKSAHVAQKAVVGTTTSKHAMKAIKVAPASAHSNQVFVIGGGDKGGGGKAQCEEGCCGDCCSKQPQATAHIAAKVPGGMAQMKRMNGGGGMPGAPMNGMGGGMGGARRPGMGVGAPPKGMPGAPMRARVMRGGMQGDAGPQQLFKMLGGGGSFTWKCDGPCEFKFGPGGAEVHCQGSCEITRSGPPNAGGPPPGMGGMSGMPGTFQLMGAGEGDEDSESADDDSGSREDNDEDDDDDDDDDASVAQASVAVRVF